MATDDLTLTSIDFLPDNLKENELYRHLAQGIDLALEPGASAKAEPLDAVLAKLRLNYADQEAVEAYYNHFVKPVIGTRSALEFAFNLLNVQPELVEWFDYTVPTPAFKFQLTFDVFPGNLDFDSLIRVVFALKNERSFLSAIRMVDCADNLVLDFGYLDRDHLSATEGYIDPATNVLICLYQQHVYPDVEADFTHVHEMQTHLYTQYYLHTVYPTLDNFDISLPWDPLYYNIIGSRGAISGFLVNYSLAGEYCVNPTDLAEHGFCKISLIDRATYHTGTYANQIVPSEFETLSNGMGFPGEYIDTYTEETEGGTLAYDLYLSDLYRLSQVTIRRTPLIEFFWEIRAADLVDTSFNADLISSISTHLYNQYVHYKFIDFTLDETLLDLPADYGRFSVAMTGLSGAHVEARSAFELPLRESPTWLSDITWSYGQSWVTPAAGVAPARLVYSDGAPVLSDYLPLSNNTPEQVVSIELVDPQTLPNISLTTLEPYHTGWGDNTIAPSEEGLLSDGRGASPTVIPDEFYVVSLSQDLTLSGEPFIWRPIYTLDYGTAALQYLPLAQPVVALDLKTGLTFQYLWAADEHPVRAAQAVAAMFYIPLDLKGDEVGAPGVQAFPFAITEQGITVAFEQPSQDFFTHIYASQLIYPERSTTLTTAHFYAQQVTRTDYSFGMYPPAVWDFSYWPGDRTWRNFSYQPRVRTARYTEDVVV